jgi:predicted O-methyltransferase YrrM
MTATAEPPSLDAVAAYAARLAEAERLLPGPVADLDAERYAAARNAIEGGFEVPATTITPLMRRFLFLVAATAGPERLYGAGTYVGFAFAWLCAGRACRAGAFHAEAVDIDPEATALAARNAAGLPAGMRPTARTADAPADLAACDEPIDLLFIDVDSPDGRKALYTDILAAARPRLRPGAMILAHDPVVALFAEDFARYHAAVEAAPELRGPLVMPLDECGISLARVAP